MATQAFEDPYSVPCPFCNIAASFPSPVRKEDSTNVQALKRCVPETVDAEKVSPACHLVLSAPEVLAFLDIMPMTAGHLLVTTRSHRVKIEDVPGEESKDIGYMPSCLLADAYIELTTHRILVTYPRQSRFENSSGRLTAQRIPIDLLMA